jgi:NADH-quinone oxidoreductase subunit N
MFNVTDYVLSLPVILLLLFAIGLWLMDRMLPPEWKWFNGVTALVGIAFAAGGLAKLQSTQNQLAHSGIMLQVGFHHALLVDNFSIFFYYLLLAAGAAATMVGMRKSHPEQSPSAGFYSAMLLAIAAMMFMASGFNLGLIFAAIVAMDMCQVAMVRFACPDATPTAAFGRSWKKYLRWRMFSSGILGLGFILLYAVTRHCSLPEMRDAIRIALNQNEKLTGHPLLALALMVTITGLILKVVAVPFHHWGASGSRFIENGASCFISITTAMSGWAMLLRICLWGFYPVRFAYTPVLIWVGVGALLVGMLAVALQFEFRRLLAYSSILHCGYMLLGFAAAVTIAPPDPAVWMGLKSVLLYLLAMLFMSAGAYAAISAHGEGDDNSREREENIGGLFFQQPVRAIFLAIFLLSIAGLPGLAGFYGKYFAYLALVATSHRWLAGLGVACAVLGLVIYARTAWKMFLHTPDQRTLTQSAGPRVVQVVMAAATVFMGFHPQPFIHLTEWVFHIG